MADSEAAACRDTDVQNALVNHAAGLVVLLIMGFTTIQTRCEVSGNSAGVVVVSMLTLKCEEVVASDLLRSC